MSEDTKDLTQLTTRIVGAFVMNNPISRDDLPALIATVHQSLRGETQAEPDAPPAMVKRSAAQIRISITPEALISFEDGRPYKMLKRHLARRGMTVADYKSKWGLPKDYPTTAPSYSQARSQMAKSIGLGQVRKAATVAKAKVTRKPRAPKSES